MYAAFLFENIISELEMERYYDTIVQQLIAESTEKLGNEVTKFIDLTISRLERGFKELDTQLESFDENLSPDIVELALRRRAAETSNKTCTVPGCSKPHYAKGFCSTHYQQMRSGRLDKILKNLPEYDSEPPKKHFIRRRTGEPDKHILVD
jgi:hypothetical protein